MWYADRVTRRVWFWRATKWSAAAAAAALLVATIRAGYHGFGYCTKHSYFVGFSQGEVLVSHTGRHSYPDPSAGWIENSSHPLSIRLWWFWEWDPSAWELRVPTWPLILGSLALGAAAWRLERRAMPREAGHCSCGYDLAGLRPGQPCPECGAIRKAAA